MSIRLLKTLIAIEERGSFSAAAEAVFVTHAAVSQQMKALEAELGHALFDRSKRSPELTPLGRAFVAKAREVVDAYDTMIPSLVRDDEIAGELSFASVPTCLAGLVPLAVSILRDRYGQLQLSVRSALTHQSLVQIQRGFVDAALISLPANLPKGLEFAVIAEEEMQLLAAPRTRTEDPLELLATAPFIRFSREAVVGGLIDGWLQRNRVRVRETMELDGLEAISSMVMANLGVSIVPKRCVTSPNQLPLKRIPLGDEGPKRTLGLVWRSGSGKQRVTSELVKVLREATAMGSFDARPATG